MSYDPRSIAFITELVHLPMQHDPKALRQVYNRLGDHDSSWYMNFNIDPSQGGAQLVTARPGPLQQRVSAVTLMPDRIQIQEEMTDLTLESYVDRMAVVAETSMQVLSIPQVNAQQCIVRSVVTPRSTQDAREFLGQRVCGFDEERLRGFGRPAGMFGLRFMFPNTENDRTVFNVRVESYNADVQSVFLEVAAVFPESITPDRQARLSTNFHATYSFLQRQVCDFVAGFDQAF